MAFCACCRQIYDPQQNWGFESKEKAEEYYAGDQKQVVPSENIKEQPQNTEEESKARGDTAVVIKVNRQNIVIFFGTKPGLGVAANTKMIRDVAQIFLTQYSRVTFTVGIPRCFDVMKGEDVNFEMVASNTLQPINVEHRHNFATYTRAIIFVHTHLKALPYEGATERGKLQEKFFRDVLQFNDTQIYTNLTKDEIIQKLSELKQEAQEFENVQEPKATLVIAIVNVGFYLDGDYQPHVDIINEFGNRPKGTDGSLYTQKYALTT